MQTLTKNNDGEELRIQTKNKKNKGIIKFINTILNVNNFTLFYLYASLPYISYWHKNNI